MKFEWDSCKAIQNERKHGVSFDEAITVFTDGHGLRISDPDHSDEEDRFILLGMSWSHGLLVVCHCFRETSDVIRIITARKATKSERVKYGVR